MLFCLVCELIVNVVGNSFMLLKFIVIRSLFEEMFKVDGIGFFFLGYFYLVNIVLILELFFVVYVLVG